MHERGARHLIDPSRLMASARLVFGDELDVLFGPLAPVDAARVRAVDARTTLPVAGGVLALPTPGHARHHLAFATADDVVFAGDVAGGAPPGGCYLMPEAPPPDIDVPAWRASLAELVALEPRRLAVSHCAILDDPVPLLRDLAERLPALAGVGGRRAGRVQHRGARRDHRRDRPRGCDLVPPRGSAVAQLRRAQALAGLKLLKRFQEPFEQRCS